MAKFIELTTKLGKTLVNLDCIDTIYSNQNTNETVLSFAGIEEYICANESYDEVLKQIKTEVKNNEKSNNI